MSYSSSIKSVTKVQSFLDDMVKGTTNLEWFAENPSKLAYYIRDGIKAATHNAYSAGEPNEPYHTYAKLPVKYIIRVGIRKVIAELRDASSLALLKEAHATMAIRNQGTVLEIIGAAITHKAHKMTFPDADPEEMNEEDLEKIYNWCQKNNYYLVVGDEITLTRDDPGDIQWTP